MNLTKQFLSLSKKARGLNGEAVKFARLVDMIVIHWIGPYPHHTVADVRNWWENGSDGTGVQASAHFIIKHNDVLQTLPLDEVGWHSGDTRNRHSIGIEVIPMNKDGEFAPDTITALKELVSFIRKTYPNAKLVRHFDGTQKKDCPRFYTPVISLLDGGGRVSNPAGGDERWITLRNYLDDVGAG